jgi:hypothetical protein
MLVSVASSSVVEEPRETRLGGREHRPARPTGHVPAARRCRWQLLDLQVDVMSGRDLADRRGAVLQATVLGNQDQLGGLLRSTSAAASRNVSAKGGPGQR